MKTDVQLLGLSVTKICAMLSYRHTAGLGLVVLEVSHAAWLASACVMIAGKKGRCKGEGRREREE